MPKLADCYHFSFQAQQFKSIYLGKNGQDSTQGGCHRGKYY